MGLRHTAVGLFETARISVSTVLDSAVGAVSAEAVDARLDAWSRKLIRDARITLVVHGREHAEIDEALIVMSNHQSLYDIPVLYRVIPGRMRMVAKKELFAIPVWGHAMNAAGFIRVDRDDRAQAIESLRTRGASLLQQGARVWIAPEGTRSRTGALGAFKAGGFRMALDLGARILPVAIRGTREVLLAKGYIVNPGKRVEVTILPPVDPSPYGVRGRKQLIEDVRLAIQAALEGRRSSSDASVMGA